MMNPENMSGGKNLSEQTDFFAVLDNQIPNEDLVKFEFGLGKEVIFDPKEKNVFYVLDYISRTRSEVHFGIDGSILNLAVIRMDDESETVESAFKTQHLDTAKKALLQNPSVFGLVSH